MKDTPIVVTDIPPLPFPERVGLRLDSIEARLAAIERQLAEQERSQGVKVDDRPRRKPPTRPAPNNLVG